MVGGGFGGSGSGQAGRRARGLGHFIVRCDGNIYQGALTCMDWMCGIALGEALEVGSGVEWGLQWSVYGF